jgi:CxxC-x17-CxxC domain-containing protein
MGFRNDGKGGYGGGYGGGRPREFHKTICSECKKDCEVPFKPSGDRPIYCKDCYSKKKADGR